MQTGARLRSVKDGQLGYLTETEDGQLAVRLDRRVDVRLIPYVAREWVPDAEPKLTPIQVARVLHEADRAMRMCLGEYGVKDWLSLREPERLDWTQKGLPKEGVAPLRRRVYDAIKGALK